MKKVDEMEINALLLGFSKLSPEQQELFMDGMNKYMYVSASRRRELRSRWEIARGKPCKRKRPIELDLASEPSDEVL